MLHGSNIEGTLRRQLWAKAALTMTELDQILVKYGEPKNFFEKFFVVIDQTGVKSKLADRRKACVWVGYVADHAAGTHCVLNPATKKISLTRDVIFLRQS